MGSTHIDDAAPGGADFGGVTHGGVLAEAIRTLASPLVLGLRSSRKRVLV